MRSAPSAAQHGHPETIAWIETMQELTSRTGMRELMVRSLMHGAALNRDGDAAAAALLAADLEGPLPHLLRR